MGHDGAMRQNSSIFAFQPSTSVTKFAKNYHTAIATSVSTVIANVIAFPLDFTKARMQTYHGTALGTMKDAYKAEGILAFWRGVGPPLISATVVRTFSMSVYQGLRKTYDRAIHDMTGVSPLEQAETPGRYPSIFTIACFSAAGATSGAITTTFACPFELTKINEQLAGKEARSGSMSAESMKAMNSGSVATARRLIRDRGYAGLYSGYRLHMLRDVIGSSVYFTTYESGKQAVASLRGKNPSDSAAIPAAGFLCGMVSWAIVSDHPLISLSDAHNPADISCRCRKDAVSEGTTIGGLGHS